MRERIEKVDVLDRNKFKEELKIEYCLTHVILSDFFTKPLQGHLLEMFRYLIMGNKYTMYFIGNMYSPIMECVGNSDEHEVIGDSVFLAEKRKSSENS